MMKMRKVYILAFTGLLMAGVTACKGSAEEEEPEEVRQEQPEEEEPGAESGMGEPAAESHPEEEDGAAKMPEDTSAADDTIDNEKLKDQYMAVLFGICTENKLPDGTALTPPDESVSEKMSDNWFAVCDIDGDGKRELLVQYVTGPTAGGRELIYDYDGETKSVREQFQEYPLLTYYDNGIIEAGWSHNQGMAGDALWPYTLWQYDPAEDTYHAVAEVDAWSWERAETDFSTNEPFPQEIDTDGDGVVYYIRPDGVHGDIEPVDGAEYEQWRDSYIGGAKAVEVMYEEMTEQNISMLE